MTLWPRPPQPTPHYIWLVLMASSAGCDTDVLLGAGNCLAQRNQGPPMHKSNAPSPTASTPEPSSSPVCCWFCNVTATPGFLCLTIQENDQGPLLRHCPFPPSLLLPRRIAKSAPPPLPEKGNAVRLGGHRVIYKYPPW